MHRAIAPTPDHDAFWIFALWRAISEFEDSDTTEADAMDALPDESDPQEPPSFLCNDPPEFSIHHYYFNFKGVFYRLDRPAFACLPTAA